MNAFVRVLSWAASAVVCLLFSGCTSPEMKGTPFYSGEYAKRNGPAEQRVNGWPLLYYRDPALSVLWPVFEWTDDHTAVRPLFSVYGLDQDKREYNVLWPIAQFDHKSGDNRVFPAFWGNDKLVLFPLYWHFGHPFGSNGGSDSLFPLWILNRHNTNDLSVWAPWPLVHVGYDQRKDESSSMVLPLYWHERERDKSLFVSPLWMHGSDTNGSWQAAVPLFYHASDQSGSTLVTPFWAQGHTPTNDWRAIIPLAYWDAPQHTMISPLWAQWRDGDHQVYVAPWSISWATSTPERTDLWLAGALARASWGEKPGSHYVLPLYYRNAAEHTFLSPICGWGDDGEFFYPLTPIAGVQNGTHSGSWLFPLYIHSREKSTATVYDNVLLLGGRSETREKTHTWFVPLFSFYNHGPLNSVPRPDQRYARYGREFWCAPFCWYDNDSRVRTATNGMVIRTDHHANGAFPLWSYSNRSTPVEGTEKVKGSMLLLLYDYRHEVTRSKYSVTNDYTRARVCWRLWHYERLNGNVSVDVFPTFTYDRKTDGFSKTSFLWRLFRHERAADGQQKIDLLFVPVKR